jgi:hypothetical protein
MHLGFTPTTHHNQIDYIPPQTKNPNQKSQLIMWEVHVAHDREHNYHDSLHSTEVAQLYPQVSDSITRHWQRVSILPIIHLLGCMASRSPYSFSQLFPAHRTYTLRFHRCGSHILQKPPFVPRLGLHHLPPKVRITPSFPSAPNICKTGKITCYLTKPTHISPVLWAVHMVTRNMNRSLGSLADTTTIQKQYLTSTRAFPYHHQTSSC